MTSEEKTNENETSLTPFAPRRVLRTRRTLVRFAHSLPLPSPWLRRRDHT